MHTSESIGGALTPFALAQRMVGEIQERPGTAAHPFIQWCLELVVSTPDPDDEIAWCAAFVNRICWLLRLPRSKSARARASLAVGAAIPLAAAQVGYDVVVLQRGTGPQPGPDVLDAPGHVGFFAGRDGNAVLVLGGNQANGVTIARFPAASVLGVRRLA